MKVLVYPHWAQEDIEDLRASFPDVNFVAARQPAEAIATAADADVLIGNLTRDVYLAASKVRWIQSHAAGVDWVTRIPELVESNVPVTNTRGAHASTIAEHTFAMLLTLTRQMRVITDAQRANEWKQFASDLEFIGLAGMTFGVVGLGNIGKAIAKRANAFETRVIAVDAVAPERPEYVAKLRGLDGLPDLLAESDVVVISTPLTDATRGMIGAAQIGLMKPTAYLILVSRGGIVDEQALADALRAGRLAGACVDVTVQEPLPSDSPLWDAPNLVISPHTSPRSKLTHELTWGFFKENLRRFIAGEELVNLIDKSRGF